jgi:hypothetical protein
MTQPQPKVPLALAVTLELHTRRNANNVSSKAHEALTTAQAVFGERAEYTPATVGGEQLPPQRTEVRVHAQSAVTDSVKAWETLVSALATTCFGNCEPQARADVVDPETQRIIVAQAPVSFLLSLEKTLTEIANFVSSIPMLPTSTRWRRGAEDGMWETDPVEELHVSVEPQSKVTSEATPEHPAQVYVWDVEVVQGTWATTRYSSAYPPEDIREILNRIERLRIAITKAKHDANLAEVPKLSVGKDVMQFLFH